MAATAVGLTLSACGKDATSSKVSMQFGSYTAQNRLFELFIPSAYAAVSEAKFCLKRLRFKTDDTETNGDDDNVDFTPGLITLETTGASLGEVTLPAGTYRRIEFDMEKDCDGTTQNGIAFTNSTASFTSDATTTIKFKGTFEANESAETLTLAVANIIDALDGITDPAATENDIKNALEAAGTF